MKNLGEVLILVMFFLFLVSCGDGEVKRTFYKNGQLESESETRDGVIKNGLGRSYFENGVLKYEGSYKNDLRDGWHVAYYPEGRMRQKTLYTIGNGKELANRTIRYNKHGDTISDFSFAKKEVSVEIRNKLPYRSYDTLFVKLKIKNPKHPYSEAVFGNFDPNLNIIGNPKNFPDRVLGNKDHEIFMKIQLEKSGLDTLKWLLRDYDFKYRTDTTGTSFGEEAYYSYPIEVLPR